MQRMALGFDGKVLALAFTHAFYALAQYSWPLLLLLLALGLLSFHPATRWMDTARYRNLVVAAALCVIAAPIGWVGYYNATDRRRIPPLNPAEFFKNQPLGSAATRRSKSETGQLRCAA